jgi:hypothetical protein
MIPAGFAETTSAPQMNTEALGQDTHPSAAQDRVGAHTVRKIAANASLSPAGRRRAAVPVIGTNVVSAMSSVTAKLIRMRGVRPVLGEVTYEYFLLERL